MNRVLLILIVFPAMVFLQTVPEASEQARMFWWAILSGTVCLVSSAILLIRTFRMIYSK